MAPDEREAMTSRLGGRIDVSRRTLTLALGDAAMIALFVALGEMRHGQPVGLGLAPFAQFGLGWLLASVPARVYAVEALASPRRAAIHGVATWVVAALIGQLIRFLVTPGTSVAPVFVLVSVVVGGVFIGIWRYIAAKAVS